jgi:hypothetical protein
MQIAQPQPAADLSFPIDFSGHRYLLTPRVKMEAFSL